MSITAVEQTNKEAILRSYGLGVPSSLAISNAAAPTAFTAPATGSAITVTTANAADLTTVGAALETLRDEVAALTVIVNAILAELN